MHWYLLGRAFGERDAILATPTTTTCASVSATMAIAGSKETKEYTTVLQHMDSIIEHLEVHSKAKESLIVKYQQRQWIATTESPDETLLVKLALNRISDDVSQYHIFIEMLKDTTGMDVVVKKIQGIVYAGVATPSHSERVWLCS